MMIRSLDLVNFLYESLHQKLMILPLYMHSSALVLIYVTHSSVFSLSLASAGSAPSISPKCCCQTYSMPSSIYSYFHLCDGGLTLAPDHLSYSIQDPPPCIQISTLSCPQIFL